MKYLEFDADGRLVSSYNGDEFVESSETIPESAVEVSDELYKAVIFSSLRTWRINRSTGEIFSESKGLELGFDAALDARVKRDALLASSDWVSLRAKDRGSPVPPEWVAYRDSLRDLPTQSGFPNSISWPSPPSPDGD